MSFNNKGYSSGRAYYSDAARIWDIDLNPIYFDSVSINGDKMYIANRVPRIKTRVIPVAAVFEKFGYNRVIKASIQKDDTGSFKIIKDEFRFMESNDNDNDIEITHTKYKKKLRENSGYIDLGIGVSYTNPSKMVLVPLEKTSTNMFWVGGVLIVLMAVVLGLCYKIANAHEIIWIIFMLLKDTFDFAWL